MKLYAVKPEWLYGDDKDAKREVQLKILNRLGIQESKAIGMAICNAEQALELFGEGYCGLYANPEDIKLLYEAKSEVDIASMIEASVSSSVEAIGKLFNETTSSEQPGPSLLNVDETLLMEDACTNALQENLDNGWRIIAVCPQPQRRPDYILGRKRGLA